MTAMTKQQANAVVAQLEMEEQMEAALNAFIAEGGDAVGPFLDGATAYENAEQMTVWGLTNLGRQALTSVSGWEISFNACRAQLVADPKWVPLEKSYAAFEASLTAAQFKLLKNGEMPGNLTAEQSSVLARIGGLEGFRKFVNGEVA